MSSSRWTKSFPLKNKEAIDEMMTVRLNDQIVMIRSINGRLEMSMFDMEYQYWENMCVKNPDVMDDGFELCLFEGNGTLFVWRNMTFGVNRLLKYDTNTMEWVIMKEYYMNGFPMTQPKVIGSKMYMVETDNNSNQLIVIDMETLKIEMSYILETDIFRQNKHHLVEVNGVLYIITDSLRIRTVSKLVEGRIEKIGEMSKRFGTAVLPIYVSNNMIHVVNNRQESIRIDIFDVVSKKWSSKDIEKSGYGYEIEAVYEDRGDMYTVLAKPSETVIRMYERIPNLSTLTMLKVTDELLKYNKMGEIEELKKSIPIDLRKQLSAIAYWREQDEKYKKMVMDWKKRMEYCIILPSGMNLTTVQERLFIQQVIRLRIH